MISNQTKGIYLAIITALISGISIFINKLAVDTIHPALVFTAVKNTWVGLLIIGILLISRKWRKIKELNKRDCIYLALIGIIGGSIPFYLFFTGLSQIPAINAAIIQKTLVLWVAILALPFLKEKLSPLQIVGIIILFFSNLIIGGFVSFQFSQGEIFILMATILWAIENVLAKKILARVDADLVTAARMGFGSLILLATAAITTPTALSKSLILNPTQWVLLSLTALALLGYVMSWYRALKLAPATTVTAILVSSTLVTNILSAIFITHAWTTTMGIQAGLMLVGVSLFWAAARRESNNIKHVLNYSKK